MQLVQQGGQLRDAVVNSQPNSRHREAHRVYDVLPLAIIPRHDIEVR